MMKTYKELMALPTFEERLSYLKLDGVIGEDTFGFNRYLNQALYKSREWRKTRNSVLIRDGGCDLGVAGHDIYTRPIIHHINPITEEDIINRNPCLFDLDNLVLVSIDTHNAIHYGADISESLFEERKQGDTKLW